MTRKTVLTNLFWRFAERCGAQGVSFVVQLALARLLAPEDYGTVAIIAVTVTKSVRRDFSFPLTTILFLWPRPETIHVSKMELFFLFHFLSFRKQSFRQGTFRLCNLFNFREQMAVMPSLKNGGHYTVCGELDVCKALLASQISYWPSYVGIIFIDPQILCFNIESCQPSHSSIILICPDTYGTIKKQSTTDKVDSAKFHTADQVQIENVFIVSAINLTCI